MTSENFSSRTAREMAKANKKKAKDKETKRSPKKTVSKIMISYVEFSFPAHAVHIIFICQAICILKLFRDISVQYIDG